MDVKTGKAGSTTGESDRKKGCSLSAVQRALYILKYLKMHTDEGHKLGRVNDLCKAAAAEGIYLGTKDTIRKTIRETAEFLNADCDEHVLSQSEWKIAYDGYIKSYGEYEETDWEDCEKDKKDSYFNMYYVHEFSHRDIDAIIEAVQFSMTLSQAETKRLTAAIEKNWASRHYKRGVGEVCKIHQKENYNRERQQENLRTIQKAIRNKVQIAYHFNGYDCNKRLVPMGDYERVASPYYIVADRGRYYLIAANEKYKEKSFFIIRIDLMTAVTIPGENVKKKIKGMKRIPKEEVNELPKKWDDNFLTSHINMSYGEIKCITLRVKNEKNEDGTPKNPEYTFLHDNFGDTYKFCWRDKDRDYDIVKVMCTSFGIENLAVTHADKIEVLSPADVRERIKEKVKILKEKYMNEWIYDELDEEN